MVYFWWSVLLYLYINVCVGFWKEQRQKNNDCYNCLVLDVIGSHRLFNIYPLFNLIFVRYICEFCNKIFGFNYDANKGYYNCFLNAILFHNLKRLFKFVVALVCINRIQFIYVFVFMFGIVTFYALIIIPFSHFIALDAMRRV